MKRYLQGLLSVIVSVSVFATGSDVFDIVDNVNNGTAEITSEYWRSLWLLIINVLCLPGIINSQIESWKKEN